MREEKITFAQWCKEKGIFEPLEKWDNNKNETTPDSISQWDTNKYWFKCCNNPEHESRLIKPGTIRKSNNISNALKCKECASFYQWCKDNDEQVLLDTFDYERNGDIDLKVLGAQSNKKYWFKCPRGIHGSYERTISVLTRKNKTTHHCPACSSIGQYIIDEYGEDGYDKIISDKNEIDPFTVSCNSDVKLWFKCTENENHPDYYHEAKVHYKGVRCPYCNGNKVCEENSAAKKFPKLLELWSNKNKKTPYDYVSGSECNVWIKCENGIHEDYKRQISNLKTTGIGCPKCKNRQSTIDKIEEMIGQKYGRLTIVGMDIEDYDKNYGKYLGARVFCQCDCGSPVKSIYLSHVTSGKIISCGCYHSEITSGENNHNWKGGITPEIRAARTSTEYIHFHKAALEKDWYTCQCCGKKSDGTKGNMHIHHILPFNEYKELRFDPSNGMALCFDCHDVKSDVGFHHIYGTHNNTPEQLEEYINNRRKDLGIEGGFKLQDYYNKDSSIQKDSIVISQNN